MATKADNRFGAAIVLGGVAAGAGLGAATNSECSRSNSTYVGMVRGAEVAAVGSLAVAALSRKYRGPALVAAGVGGVVALFDIFGAFKGLKVCA